MELLLTQWRASYGSTS